MDTSFFFKGVLFGFLIAVPVGPMGLLCISRALFGGLAYGLYSGLGVAAGDALAAGVAALGLTLIVEFLISQQLVLRLSGGLFLCYLGVNMFSRRVSLQAIEPNENGMVRGVASAFFLTVTNPATLISFLAIYAGWGVQDLSGHYFPVMFLTLGVFVGSALWWVLLGLGYVLLQERFTDRGLFLVHRVSGVLIAGFGFAVVMNPLIASWWK